MKKSILSLLPLLLPVLFLGSCGDDDEQAVPGGGASASGPSASASVPYRLEVPAMKSGNQLLAHWSVEGGDSVMTYCVEYDRSKYHARWVAFRFDARTRPKTVSRKNGDIRPQYPADPLLPAQWAIGDDTSFGRYQHGHLCASADRLYSRTANDNTFYMTNMSPQIGHFNSPYWSAFEAKVQDLGRDASFADTLYVAKGGTIADGQVLEYVAGNRMPVPKYYFMALLKVKNGAYSSIAFWMEHKDYGSASPAATELAARAVSVNRLEELTGIDFFHNLPDANGVEETIESQCLPAAWGM